MRRGQTPRLSPLTAYLRGLAARAGKRGYGGSESNALSSAETISEPSSMPTALTLLSMLPSLRALGIGTRV
ncbi:MAG: hypothetical protein V3U45_07925, partial [bacterium]